MTEVKDIVEFQPEWYSNASPDEQQMFRAWLINTLETNPVVNITFKKKDGTLRTMNCTSMEGICPVVENKKTSDTLCTVWDTDLNAWRSFKFENITEINFKL